MSYTFALKNIQSLPTIAFLKILSLVLGFGLDQSCPWPREGLYLKSRSLVLASNFFQSLTSIIVSSTPGLLQILNT